MKSGSKVPAVPVPAVPFVKPKITDALQTYYDDSSDEEDDYQDISEEKLVENAAQFVASHPDISPKTLEIAFVLEDQGRRILYKKPSRVGYHNKRAKFKLDAQQLATNIDRINFLEVLISGLQESCNKLYPKSKIDIQDFLKDFIKEYSENQDKADLLPRLVLKQSNGEFVIKEFADIADKIKGKILELYVADVGQNDAIQNSQKSKHQLSSERLFQDDKIKKPLKQKVADKLKEFQAEIKIIQDEIVKIESRKVNTEQEKKEQKEDKKAKEEKIHEKLAEAGKFFGVVLTSAIKKFLQSDDSSQSNPNATALNGLVKNILHIEIDKYLKEGFLDQPKPELDIKASFLLDNALKIARDQNLQTITNCTKAKFEDSAGQDNLKNTKRREIDSNFGRFLRFELQQVLKRENFIPLQRRVLKKSYVDVDPIKSVGDLYGKEHLLYRSTTRQARGGEYQDIARTVIFDDENDLAVQKQQKVTEGSGGNSLVVGRGTIQEMVLNLGNYDEVLEKIKKLNQIPSFQDSDKNSATILRRVYKSGIGVLSKIKNKETGKSLAELMTNEQKQTTIALVELFFGTEGFRSPAAIVEVNMALDLIIAGKSFWKDVLTGKKSVGGGGDLSLTMKVKSGGGGTESGRRLSEDVNQYHNRIHKYGGEPIKKGDDGYAEFLSRKVALAEKWVELQSREDADNEDRKDEPRAAITPKSFSGLIKAQDEKWYGIKY